MAISEKCPNPLRFDVLLYLQPEADIMNTRQDQPQSARLLAAAPILEFAVSIQGEINLLKKRLPNNDAVDALQSVARELASVIEEAARVEVWVNIEQLASLTRKPESTLRRLCDRYGKHVGARKVAGAWIIHWPTFEQFLSGSHPTASKAA